MTIIRRCRTRVLPSGFRSFLFVCALKFHLLIPRRQMAKAHDLTYILPAIAPSSTVGDS